MRSSAFWFIAIVVAAAAAGCSESTPTAGGAAANAGAGDEAASADDSGAADETADAGDAAASAADEEATADAAPAVDPVEQVKAHVNAGELDEALAKIEAAVDADVDDFTMMSVRDGLATALEAADRGDEALAQRQKLATRFLVVFADTPAAEALAMRQVDLLLALADRLGGDERVEQVLALLDKSAAGIEENRALVVAALTGRRAMHLANVGRAAEAREILSKALDAAPTPAADAANPAEAVLVRSQLLMARANLEGADAEGDEDAAWDTLLDDLFAADAAHAEVEEIRGRLLNVVLTRAGRLGQFDPDRADALLDRLAEIEEFNVPRQDAAAVANSANAATEYQTPAKANIFRTRLRIADARRLVALYGTPAEFPVTADRWVNSEAAVTPEQLRGKVVLLDFFAVWCGPCIATFPHLREWQDKFGDDGFQIIGVSNYQNYGWNDELSRAQREPGITPDKERDDLAKFAKHYELPYPIALTPDRSLQEHYLISGIPHVVLIDRAGKVRLHRVGSGEQNARDLEHAIEECLKESPTGPAA
jgi:thiol-disulfide isomerase/thioredoxin